MLDKIEIIVRALVIKDRKILLCKNVAKDYYFLPGGHVEYGETMQEALRREIFEELGAGIVGSQFIGVIENIFHQEKNKKHEVSFVFRVEIDLEQVTSREEHISFHYFSMDEFIEEYFLPPALKDAIIRWNAEKEPFFIDFESG